MKHYTLLFLSILGLLFSSCDDGELDLWEVVELEATCPLLTNSSNVIVSCGTTNTKIDIKSNAEWQLSIPEWMEADQIQGTGNAVVNLTINPNNDLENQRAGSISIGVDGPTVSTNIIGARILSLGEVVQKSKREGVTFTFDAETQVSPIDNYNYKCWGTYSYTITTDMTETEYAEYISDVKIVIESKDKVFWEMESLPTAPGTYDGILPEQTLPRNDVLVYVSQYGFYAHRDFKRAIYYKVEGCDEYFTGYSFSTYWGK